MYRDAKYKDDEVNVIKRLSVLVFVVIASLWQIVAFAQEETDEELLAKGMWRDTETGLIWMRCVLGQEWTGKDCQGKPKELNWWNAIRAAKAANFAEHDDWRLPSAPELNTLLAGEVIKGKEAWDKVSGESLPFEEKSTAEQADILVNMAYSGVKGYKTDSLVYVFALRSSSLVANDSDYAWMVGNGYGSIYHDKNDNYYVRLVRSSQSFGVFERSLALVQAGDPAEDKYLAEIKQESDKPCFPDRRKWTSSNMAGVYYQPKATILTLKNGSRYIQLWVNRLSNSQSCEFEKEYMTIDCISRSKGKDWPSLEPVDPDSDDYELLGEICKQFSGKRSIKKAKK